MLKSLSESLRSLWQTKTDEAVEERSRKRKRSSNECDLDDLDVEVVSVKLPKKQAQESSLGLLGVLRVPMSKMSEWVRKKTVRQDHFFVRPIPHDSHWHQAARRAGGRDHRGGGEENRRSVDSGGQTDPQNGLLVHHDDDRLSGLPGYGNRQPRPPAQNDTVLRTPAHSDVVTRPPAHSDVVTRPPAHSDVVTRPPAHSDVVTRPPAHSDVVTRPPAHSDVVTRPPAHSDVVTRPPAHSDVVTRPPAHNDVVTRPPAHSDVVTRPPAHSDVVTRPPAHSDVVTRPPAHSDVVTLPPAHSDVVTRPPAHSDIVTRPPAHSDVVTRPPAHSDVVTRPPAHSDRWCHPSAHDRSGAEENGMNGERGTREKVGEAMNKSRTLSQCSSSSSSQPGTGRHSTTARSYHLKERADYLKLLQQFTTVDLGYHGSRNKTEQAGAHLTCSQRKPGLYLPLPSAALTPTSFSTSSSAALSFTSRRSDTRPPRCPPARFMATPSRYVHTSSSTPLSFTSRRLDTRPPPCPPTRFTATPSRYVLSTTTSSSLLPPSGQTATKHPPSTTSASLGVRCVRHARPGRALLLEKAPSSTPTPTPISTSTSTPTPCQATRTSGTSLTAGEQGSSWQGEGTSVDLSVNSTPQCAAQERLKEAPCFSNRSLKGAQHSDGDGRLNVASDLGDEQFKATAELDVRARLEDTTETDAVQHTVSDGHKNDSLAVQSKPSLNFMSSEYLNDDWLSKLNEKYATSEMERQRLITEAEVQKTLLEERREARLANLGKKLEHQLRLFDEESEVIEERPLPEVPQEKLLPELTEAMLRDVKQALAEGSLSEVLTEGFRLQLTRADIATLRGLNWLNDEVINFYMNLLMERGEGEGFEKTYAFNTFFYPKLLGGGHAAVKRWTRKVDVFSHVYLVIPVHLGVHWCLCMVFVRDKKICYYDSMGGSNNQCLNAVRQYLAEESQQKRNVQLDLSQWTSHIIKDIPQQMNGSDCGMFACMYAETLTRGDNIIFTQKDMPYFRKRMVYELLRKKLLC